MGWAAIDRTSRCVKKMARAQAMAEFIMMGFVAMIILFVAIQMAAIGREYMALGELNYQVTRWATNPTNNTLLDAKGNPVASPQCSDVATLISGGSVSPYNGPPTNAPIATGYMGKIASLGVSCGGAVSSGISVAMVCMTPGASTVTTCAGVRPAGTAVQITLTMGTSSILFLNLGSSTNPNFLGIPFPASLSVEHTMLTQ
jgi:hypothetical protein